MTIFKTYDIRGTYPDEVNEEIFHKIGFYLGQTKLKTVAVGRDARLSSPKLFTAFVSGIVDSGINVLDLGTITSPMLSYFCSSKRIMGAMITASHNPKKYNGIKFIDEKGIQLGYKDYLFKIEKNLNKTERFISKKKGKVISKNIIEEYVTQIAEHFKNKLGRKIKIVFDCSNGVASIPLIGLIKKLGLNATLINKELNGNFPNHDPDQTKKENLVQLQKEVRKNKADMGIIFDGDADRIGFVDEKGEIVRIDLAFVLFAKDLINKKTVKKPKIIYDLRLSKYISEFLKENKTDYEILRVGNPFYKKKMCENKNIVLAGELSGHIMFSQNKNIDDAIFAALRMIEILSNENKNFSEMIKPHNKYYSSVEISLPVKNSDKILNILKKSYKGKIETIDGITLTTDRFWFNVRPSNTEPLIRLIAEGYKKSEVESQVKKIKRIIFENDKK